MRPTRGPSQLLHVTRTRSRAQCLGGHPHVVLDLGVNCTPSSFVTELKIVAACTPSCDLCQDSFRAEVGEPFSHCLDRAWPLAHCMLAAVLP